MQFSECASVITFFSYSLSTSSSIPTAIYFPSSSTPTRVSTSREHAWTQWPKPMHFSRFIDAINCGTQISALGNVTEKVIIDHILNRNSRRAETTRSCCLLIKIKHSILTFKHDFAQPRWRCTAEHLAHFLQHVCNLFRLLELHRVDFVANDARRIRTANSSLIKHGAILDCLNFGASLSSLPYSKYWMTSYHQPEITFSSPATLIFPSASRSFTAAPPFGCCHWMRPRLTTNCSNCSTSNAVI